MKLNSRQRVKANAALTLISLLGYNPRTVQNAAKANIAKGDSHAVAYQKALEAFCASVPSLRDTLETALLLIQNSDDATVAQYSAAIDAYNKTGDEAPLEALAPMIVQDMNALAVKHGEAQPGSALFDDIQAALGIQEAAFAAQPYTPEPNAAQAPSEAQASTFQFTNAVNPSQRPPASQQPQQAQSAAPINDPTQPQISVMGYRPGMTGERARQWHGTPMGDIAYIKTATGYRVAPTGDQARREAGVPLGPDA